MPYQEEIGVRNPRDWLDMMCEDPQEQGHHEKDESICGLVMASAGITGPNVLSWLGRGCALGCCACAGQETTKQHTE